MYFYDFNDVGVFVYNWNFYYYNIIDIFGIIGKFGFYYRLGGYNVYYLEMKISYMLFKLLNLCILI